MFPHTRTFFFLKSSPSPASAKILPRPIPDGTLTKSFELYPSGLGGRAPDFRSKGFFSLSLSDELSPFLNCNEPHEKFPSKTARVSGGVLLVKEKSTLCTFRKLLTSGLFKTVRSRVRPPAHLWCDTFPRHFVTETPGNRVRNTFRVRAKR